MRPKIETEDLLYSITKNCETLIKQTHGNTEETLEFEKIKTRETFHFNPPVDFKEDWMIGLTDLEVYNSIFNINTANNNIKLYKFLDEKPGGVSYEKVRDEIKKDLDVSDITTTDLQDDKKQLLLNNIGNRWHKEWKMLDIWIFHQFMLVLNFKNLKNF